MMRVNMKSELDSLMVRNDLSQKEAAVGSGIPFSTFNGYTKGSQEVPINKAAEINNAGLSSASFTSWKSGYV